MDDDRKIKQKLPDAAECRELVRDWELLFWMFLLFGLGRLLWLSLAGTVSPSSQLGISYGFLLCGILGFLMRYVLSPGLKSKRIAERE